MAPDPEFPATCPGCHAVYRVPSTMAGLLVTCESCQTNFVLPDITSGIPDPVPLAAAKPRPHALLNNALLLVTGAAAVWGVSSYLKQPSSQPSAPAPSLPADAVAPVFTSVNKRRPVPAVPATASSGSAVPAKPVSPLPPVPGDAPDPTSPAPTGTTPPAPPAAPVAVAAVKTPTVDPAKFRNDSRLALERFLRASTMEERLALSQNPAKIRKAMEEHYQTYPMGPLPFDEIAFLTDGEVPGTQKTFHLYNVMLRGEEAPIPMAVEETGDGYRVDWPTFAESYTHRLRAFFETPSPTPGLFRVMLRRAHYFGPAVPGQDTIRIAYSVEPPGRDDSFHVWVDKDSLVYREKLATGERAGWDAQSYVIVELMWQGDDTRGRWVSLRRIAHDSWRAE